MRLSDREWQIMNCVWGKSPVTAREVREDLVSETGWAYTTVKTMMTRLVEKGALLEERRGTTAIYRAGVTRRRARTTALRALLDRAFQGAAGPLVHSLLEHEKLSAKERDLLRKLLDRDDDDS